MAEHPIRLRVEDDLRRSRLTVFFRLLLAIPHVIWLGIFTFAASLMAIANWFATLVKGQPPDTIHEFLSAYVRYATHVNAYLFLAANPYPGFVGTPGNYPVDLEIEPPARQNRWTVVFRLVLAIPAFLLFTALIGWGGPRAGIYGFVAGLLGTVAFLGWFACLARGAMPRGMRDLQTYALRYVAQVDAYFLLLTDRYPDSRPDGPREEHPIAIAVRDDLRRSRLTVFFRLLLTLPHMVWISLWGILAFLAAVANWFATLVRGVPARPLHRFLAAYLRYSTHVSAFLFLVANPFPGFIGAPGRYPVDLELPPPARQSRWITGFRGLLFLPAAFILSAVQSLLYVAAFLAWFHALVRGRTTQGLRDLSAYVLRYQAQTYGYVYLLTERYPYSGPPA